MPVLPSDNWKTSLCRSIIPDGISGHVIDLGCLFGAHGIAAMMNGKCSCTFIDNTSINLEWARRICDHLGLTERAFFQHWDIRGRTALGCDTLLAFFIFHWVDREDVDRWLAACRERIVFALRPRGPIPGCETGTGFYEADEFRGVLNKHGFKLTNWIDASIKEEFYCGVAERSI